MLKKISLFLIILGFVVTGCKKNVDDVTIYNPNNGTENPDNGGSSAPKEVTITFTKGGNFEISDVSLQVKNKATNVFTEVKFVGKATQAKVNLGKGTYVFDATGANKAVLDAIKKQTKNTVKLEVSGSEFTVGDESVTANVNVDKVVGIIGGDFVIEKIFSNLDNGVEGEKSYIKITNNSSETLNLKDVVLFQSLYDTYAAPNNYKYKENDQVVDYNSPETETLGYNKFSALLTKLPIDLELKSGASVVLSPNNDSEGKEFDGETIYKSVLSIYEYTENNQQKKTGIDIFWGKATGLFREKDGKTLNDLNKFTVYNDFSGEKVFHELYKIPNDWVLDAATFYKQELDNIDFYGTNRPAVNTLLPKNIEEKVADLVTSKKGFKGIARKKIKGTDILLDTNKASDFMSQEEYDKVN